VESLSSSWRELSVGRKHGCTGLNSVLILWCRFHPSCMSFTPEQVKKMEQFVCPDCSLPDGDRKLRQSSPGSTPPPDHFNKVCYY
jgi:hypothetical protein